MIDNNSILVQFIFTYAHKYILNLYLSTLHTVFFIFFCNINTSVFVTYLYLLLVYNRYIYIFSVFSFIFLFKMYFRLHYFFLIKRSLKIIKPLNLESWIKPLNLLFMPYSSANELICLSLTLHQETMKISTFHCAVL